jgi:hypothetical protein
MRAFLWLILLLLGASAAAQAAERREIANDPAALATLASDPHSVWTVRDVEIESLGATDLDLREVEVFEPSSRLVVHDGRREVTVRRPPTRYMRGTIRGMAASVVAVTVTADGRITGLLNDGRQKWQLQQRAADARLEAVIVDGRRGKPRKHFQCAFDTLIEPPELAAERLLQGEPVTAEELPQGQYYQVKVAIETDYEFFQLFGDATAASDYIGSLFNYVSGIYEVEIQAQLVVGDVFLWQAPADPWVETGTDCRLREFGRFWRDNRSDVTRTIAHFLSGADLGGGIAYAGSLCAPPTSSIQETDCVSVGSDLVTGGFAVSSQLEGFYESVSGIAWDAVVVAHEIGHNFSSPHTHCYGGKGGVPSPVDACDSVPSAPGVCWTGAPSLPGPGSLTGGTAGGHNGTLMSYCHQLSGGMGNIAATFGFGHPDGVRADRVPTQMFSHVAAVAASNPICIPVVGVQRTLTVTKAGSGSGTVTSSPTGINCGGDCSESYPSGTNVTLTASAAGGSTFAGWSGGTCLGTAGTCAFSMTQDRVVTATFKLTEGSNPLGDAVDNTVLTWTTGGGAAWFAQSGVWYSGGSAARSGAIADDQSTWIQTTVTGPGTLSFRWKVSSEATYDFLTFYVDDVAQAGEISGEVDWALQEWSIPAGVHMLKWQYAKDYSTATGTDAGWLDQVVFTPTGNQTLTVAKAGAGSGSVTSNPEGINCGVDCIEGYSFGTRVALTAAPDGGSTFAGWSGGGCSGTAGCMVTMNAATTVTASFDLVGDTTPDPFGFTPQAGIALNTTVTSNTITPSGYNTATSISVANGQYSIGCTATFTASAGTISPGQSVCVRHTAASTAGTAVTTMLTIGGVSGSFSSTTAGPALFRAYLAADGNDANPCTLAAPCRLLPTALNAVASGGEIWMLDSANYNTSTVAISKSVSILAVPGVVGSVVATGGPAIRISLPGLTVALRNLVIAPAITMPAGTDGVFMTSSSHLAIEDSVIANLPRHGVSLIGGTLKLVNTILRNNGAYAIDLAGGASATISGAQIVGYGDGQTNNGGVAAWGNAVAATTAATISNSVISGGAFGVRAQTSVDGAARISVRGSTIELAKNNALDSSTFGVGTAEISIGSSLIIDNVRSWYQSGAGSSILSLGNNQMSGNGGFIGVKTPLAPQ